MHYLRHSNYKLGKLLPLGLICSIGMVGIFSHPVSAVTATATISIGEISGDQNITKIKSGTGSFSVPITISVNHTYAYTVSFWANNANLSTGVSGDREIEAVSTPTSLGQMPDNKWGYRYNFGNSAYDDSSSNYSAMPAGEGNAKKIDGGITYKGVAVSSKPANSPETKVLTLGYGAAVAEDFPAGQYKNQITVAVTMQPEDLTMFGIETMQEMTHEICQATLPPSNTATLYDDDGSYQGDARYIPRTMLRDTRDDHWYIVSKLADGNCWMTENLALVGGTTLTSEKSNVTSSYTLPASDTLKASDPTRNTLNNASTFSDPKTDYVFNGDALDDSMYKSTNKPSNISSYKNTWDNSAHSGHTGAFYSWPAATAGTGKNGAIAGGTDATSDICPKNWHLPSGGAEGANKEFEVLYKGNPGGYNSVVANFDIAFHNGTPFLRGTWYGGAMSDPGGHTRWWSRTSYDNGNAFWIAENGVKVVSFNYLYGRCNGYVVRCVAK